MRSALALAGAVLAGCTTVVQEPLDLDAARVEALSIADDGAGAVHLSGPAGWTDPGKTVFVTNRLTGVVAFAEAGDDGALDLRVAGQPADVFAVSLDAAAVDPAQITRRDGATVGAWGWGFGGEPGCAHGDFPVGSLVEAPDAHDPDAYDRCASAPSPTPDGAGHDVLAVGTSALHLEVGGDAEIGARLLVRSAGSVWVRVSATGADGHDRVYERLEDFLDVEADLWSRRTRAPADFVAADGVPLGEGDVVRGLFFGPPPGHALELEVDDTIFASVRPTETPF